MSDKAKVFSDVFDSEEDQTNSPTSNTTVANEPEHYVWEAINVPTAQKVSNINYKFDEDVILQELKDYIDSTYNQHYSRNKFQATEFILDSGHGEGFCIGNIMKYAQRYGKKNGYNKADIMKVLHYAVILLANHKEYREGTTDADGN